MLQLTHGTIISHLDYLHSYQRGVFVSIISPKIYYQISSKLILKDTINHVTLLFKVLRWLTMPLKVKATDLTMAYKVRMISASLPHLCLLTQSLTTHTPLLQLSWLPHASPTPQSALPQSFTCHSHNSLASSLTCFKSLLKHHVVSEAIFGHSTLEHASQAAAAYFSILFNTWYYIIPLTYLLCLLTLSPSAI